MKTLSIIALALLCAGHAFAQDRVITKEGDVFNAYRIDIGGTYIYYTKEDKEGAALQKIAKGDVLMIKKKDGTKLDFSNQITDHTTENKHGNVNNNKVITPSIPLEEVKELNKKLIDTYNVDITVDVDEKTKNDRAKELWARYGMKENSILTDGILTLTVNMGALRKANRNDRADFIHSDCPLYDPSISIELYNESDNTVYVDLSNCFYVSLGSSSSYYTPTSTTTINSASSGIGVNLGAVANSIGIGGVVGSLANSVNVGHNSSNGVSQTTYSQRIVAIPPKSNYNMDARYLFRELSNPFTGLRHRALSGYSYIKIFEFSFPKNVDKGALLAGERLTYSDEHSPLTFSAIVSYSLTEDCSNLQKLSANMYLKDIVGTYENAWGTKKVQIAFEKNKQVKLVGMKGYIDNWSSSYFPKQ